MVEKEKKCIGIIFGGNSNEHYVSISSAKTVIKALISNTNKERFRVKAFYINKYGVWFDNNQSLEILRILDYFSLSLKIKFLNLLV